MDFSGKYILVTGASSGIGREVCRYLDSLGANIVMVARNRERLESLSGELLNSSIVIEGDLSKLNTIGAIFEELAQRGVKLDGMVHSAGQVHVSPVKAVDLETMQNDFNVNLLSFIELGRYFSMKKHTNDGASVVAISSLGAISNDKGQVVYAASKSGINSAVKVMAKEFLRRKQRVNAIMPSMVDTEMGRAWYGMMYGDEASWPKQPLGDVDPVHVAYLVGFLMSDKAKYITGATIPIGAGVVL